MKTGGAFHQLRQSEGSAAMGGPAASRIRADDRRRRRFSGELYTLSPKLARDLDRQ